MHTSTTRQNLARRSRIRGWHVHDRVRREKVPRPEQKSNRLGRHDGEVLRRGYVCDAKGVPKDDVLVVDGLSAVADPLREAVRRLARGLRDVPTGGPELVIRVCDSQYTWGTERVVGG